MIPFKDLPIAHYLEWRGEKYVKIAERLLDRGPNCPEPDELVPDKGLFRRSEFFADPINNPRSE